MEPVIVELNQRSAEYSKPGEYRVQLAQPIIINQGDQLAFRMASIDTLKTSADTIVIDSDVTLSASFSYYDVDYSITDKARYDGSGTWLGDGYSNPTFDYYAAYNTVGYEQLTTIITQILGYRPPLADAGGGNYVINYNVTGGSFLVGTFGTASNVDPRVQFTVTFSYIDQTNKLQFFKCSGTTVQLLPPSPFWSGQMYGTLSPQQLNQQNGGFFELRQLDGTSLSLLNIVYKTGTLKLASLSGYWPGKYLNNDGKTIPSFGDVGSNAPQGTFPDPNEGADYDTEYPVLASQFRFVPTTTIIAASQQSLDVQNLTAVLKAGKYDPASLAVQLTQLFSSADGLVQYNNQSLFQPVNTLLTRTDGPLNENMVFRRMNIPAGTTNVTFANSNTYLYNAWATTKEPIPYFIGASTFAIEYGQAGPVYQISYAHTPLSNPARPGEQDLGIYHYTDNSGNLQFNVTKAAGGIAIHDLQPTSFWQNTIGLRDKLIVPLQTDQSGVQFYDKQSLLNSITEGFHGLGSFLLPATETGTNVYNDPRKVSPIPPLSNPVYIDITGQSRAIIGESPQENVQEGFYLIEVLNFFRRTGGYIDSQENRINISAIASTQYLNANAITAFADSGIPYQHLGQSYMISDAFVRILDPITKQLATGLGENTCIFLQIDRMRQSTLPEPFPERPATQDEHEGVEKHEGFKNS
jgi:hypothetical protein